MMLVGNAGLFGRWGGSLERSKRSENKVKNGSKNF